jgi:hypothetical protein
MTAQRAIQNHMSISYWEYMLDGLARAPGEPSPWYLTAFPAPCWLRGTGLETPREALLKRNSSSSSSPLNPSHNCRHYALRSPSGFLRLRTLGQGNTPTAMWFQCLWGTSQVTRLHEGACHMPNTWVWYIHTAVSEREFISEPATP